MATVGLPEVESVTTNMSAEFAKPFGQLGDDLIIEGECVQQGELRLRVRWCWLS